MNIGLNCGTSGYPVVPRRGADIIGKGKTTRGRPGLAGRKRFSGKAEQPSDYAGRRSGCSRQLETNQKPKHGATPRRLGV